MPPDSGAGDSAGITDPSSREEYFREPGGRHTINTPPRAEQPRTARGWWTWWIWWMVWMGGRCDGGWMLRMIPVSANRPVDFGLRSERACCAATGSVS